MPQGIGYGNENMEAAGTNETGLGGFTAVPNSSIQKLDRTRAREMMAEEEAIRADERARVEARSAIDAISEDQRRIERNNAGIRGFEEGIRRGGGLGGLSEPTAQNSGSDVNSYIANGLTEGTLDPAEAMMALKDPDLAPELAAAINEQLMAGGGGTPREAITEEAAVRGLGSLGDIR